MFKVILASKSPRRKEILEQVGVSFTVIPSQKEEVITCQDPVAVVKELALIKAEEVADAVPGPALIIGADTIVVHHHEILGKPRDAEHAREMLKNLQGQKHEVYSGVALVLKNTGQADKVLNFSVCTRVGICPMSEQQIEAYIATGEPFDKAGAYGIQGRFAVYVNQLEGDYYNVVGLPISRIYEVLRENGIDLCNYENDPRV